MGGSVARSPRRVNAAPRNGPLPYLLFLNNDTVVFPGAISTALESIRSNDAIGVLGARLLYPDYSIQHAGMAIDENLRWCHVFRGAPAEHPLVLVRRAFQAVTGAFLVIERGLFERLGGFDEGYLNSYEDVDLCPRVRDAGKEVVYDPNVVLFHYESITEGRTRADDANRVRFLERWRGRLEPDFREKTEVFAQKTRDLLVARMREALERDSSPYRSLAYTRWDDDPGTHAFRMAAASFIACEETLRRERVERELHDALRAGAAAQAELARVKGGLSYRLGLALTWLPRKIARRT